MRARTAVIPAAGMGTRFLPATKAVPKELLPIIDTPALQLIIDEAVGAGFDHVVVITSHAKPAIEAYFQPAPEIMAKLRKSGRGALADRLQRTADSARISFAYQDDPHGLGHAVGCAREAVGDEPFAVLLPDEIMGDSSLLAQMADVAASSGGSVVGLKRVPPAEVSAYGVVETDGDVDADGVVRVRTMVEKPAMKDAPSDLILIGRYVLAAGTFEAINRVVPAADGEIQLTDALKILAADGPFHGVVSKISRYDTGNPFGWLTAVVDLALDDEQIGTQFRAWLKGRAL